MKPILRLLIKLWVQQFYLRNAGFFLFLFVVLFGVVQNPMNYHYKLMQSIVTSGATLIIAMMLWLLYAGKCTAIILKSLAEEKLLLYQLQAVANKPLLLLLLVVQALLLLPASVYILFTIGIGVYMHQYVAASVLVIFLVMMHVVGVAWYYRALFGKMMRLQLLGWPVFTFPFSKGFYSFLLWHSFYKGKLKTVAVKFFSLLLLFIPLVWNSDHVELSDFVLFFQISIAAHAVIVYDNVQFLERRFTSLRNVPVPLYKMMLLFVVTYAALLIPEGFFLVYYSSAAQLGVSIFSLLLYSIAQLLVFTSVAYEKHQKIENYLLYIGLITAVSLMLTPLKSFGWIGVALIIIAFTLFANNYYQYEPEYQ